MSPTIALRTTDTAAPILVDGHLGLGDAVYMRPFVVELARRSSSPVYWETPWPEMAWDQPRILPVRPRTELRVQAMHAQSYTDWWYVAPAGARRMFLSYVAHALARESSVLEALSEQSGIDSWDFRLPLREEWIARARAILGDSKTCIIKPPTLRAEWRCPSRNPDPAAFAEAVATMRELGFRMVAIGHLADGEEWLDGCPEDGWWDEAFLHGEIPWYIVAAMMRVAEWVLTCQSFPTPLGAAVGARVFTVYGGYAPPSFIEHQSMGDRLWHAAPDPFCFCIEEEHECREKRIPGIDDAVRRWVEEAQ